MKAVIAGGEGFIGSEAVLSPINNSAINIDKLTYAYVLGSLTYTML